MKNSVLLLCFWNIPTGTTLMDSGGNYIPTSAIWQGSTWLTLSSSWNYFKKRKRIYLHFLSIRNTGVARIIQSLPRVVYIESLYLSNLRYIDQPRHEDQSPEINLFNLWRQNRSHVVLMRASVGCDIRVGWAKYGKLLYTRITSCLYLRDSIHGTLFLCLYLSRGWILHAGFGAVD